MRRREWSSWLCCMKLITSGLLISALSQSSWWREFSFCRTNSKLENYKWEKWKYNTAKSVHRISSWWKDIYTNKKREKPQMRGYTVDTRRWHYREREREWWLSDRQGQDEIQWKMFFLSWNICKKMARNVGLFRLLSYPYFSSNH